MNLVAPSPSRTIACASVMATFSIAARMGASRGSLASLIGARSALPVAAITKLSLVDVSPSTVAPVERDFGDLARSASELRPNRRVGTKEGQHRRQRRGGSSRHPWRSPSPSPECRRRRRRRDAALGTVSVVMMALAAANQPWGAPRAPGKP
jgi:hypothetical protein